jgi:hypothetical protein
MVQALEWRSCYPRSNRAEVIGRGGREGAKLLKNGAFDFTAKGSIDLWRQQPGQYATGPDGLANTIGKGGVHKAGKLIGKIGATGVVFEIGEKLSITATETGQLYLKIVESPWNNVSSGQYEVRIMQLFLGTKQRVGLCSAALPDRRDAQSNPTTKQLLLLTLLLCTFD